MEIREENGDTVYDGMPTAPVLISVESKISRDNGMSVSKEQEGVLTDIVMHEACTQVTRQIEAKSAGARTSYPDIVVARA